MIWNIELHVKVRFTIRFIINKNMFSLRILTFYHLVPRDELSWKNKSQLYLFFCEILTKLLLTRTVRWLTMISYIHDISSDIFISSDLKTNVIAVNVTEKISSVIGNSLFPKSTGLEYARRKTDRACR